MGYPSYCLNTKTTTSVSCRKVITTTSDLCKDDILSQAETLTDRVSYLGKVVTRLGRVTVAGPLVCLKRQDY